MTDDDAADSFAASLTLTRELAEPLSPEDALLAVTNYPRLLPWLTAMGAERRLRCERALRRRLESLLLDP